VNPEEVIQVPPGLTRAEVHDDNAVATFRARVRDIGNPLTRLGDVRPQIEADIVVIIWGWRITAMVLTESGKDTFWGNKIVLKMVLVVRSTPTSLGPP
jgi:hypothetical protein